jgi:hypothetical protein
MINNQIVGKRQQERTWREEFVRELEGRLIDAKARLERLESGKIIVGLRSPEGPWKDKTRYWIDRYKRAIEMYGRLLEHQTRRLVDGG